mgnify:CR=1 FL=1
MIILSVLESFDRQKVLYLLNQQKIIQLLKLVNFVILNFLLIFLLIITSIYVLEFVDILFGFFI